MSGRPRPKWLTAEHRGGPDRPHRTLRRLVALLSFAVGGIALIAVGVIFGIEDAQEGQAVKAALCIFLVGGGVFCFYIVVMGLRVGHRHNEAERQAAKRELSEEGSGQKAEEQL